MNKNTKRKILTLGVLLTLVNNNTLTISQPNYEIYEEDPYFATYSLGKIYIGKYSFLKENKDKIGENDIAVLDQRDGKDPNMKVFNSASILDKDIINEILEALCKYEECYPSNWDRTIDSMRIEWIMHNMSYYFDYEKKRTRDVDLNNADEEVYSNTLYSKILNL